MFRCAAAAFLTQPVEDCSQRIQLKVMLLIQMSLHALELITVQVDQLPAFLTFAVETVLPDSYGVKRIGTDRAFLPVRASVRASGPPKPA